MLKSDSPKIFSVSEFVKFVKVFLTEQVGPVIVQGEISGFQIYKERLVYFSLKDKTSQVQCFMLREQLRINLANGMEIKILGVPELAIFRGTFQLRFLEIELLGQGALLKAFEELKKKLTTEGLFAPEHKQLLPRFPETIGLITSPDAAAYTDVLRILKNRWSGLNIKLYPVAVQGLEAPGKIVQAFNYFNRTKDADILILTRGGGSLEDLQAFNDERVARAVFASVVPVVCGVGHERDESLADYAADVRAATPSNAAEIVVPDKVEISLHLARLAVSAKHHLQMRVDNYSSDINNYMTGYIARIEDRISRGKLVIGERVSRLRAMIDFSLKDYHRRAEEIVRLFSNLSPRSLLAKGYSLLWNKSGRLIKSIQEIELGAVVRSELSDGEFNSQVITKK